MASSRKLNWAPTVVDSELQGGVKADKYKMQLIKENSLSAIRIPESTHADRPNACDTSTQPEQQHEYYVEEQILDVDSPNLLDYIGHHTPGSRGPADAVSDGDIMSETTELRPNINWPGAVHIDGGNTGRKFDLQQSSHFPMLSEIATTCRDPNQTLEFSDARISDCELQSNTDNRSHQTFNDHVSLSVETFSSCPTSQANGCHNLHTLRSMHSEAYEIPKYYMFSNFSLPYSRCSDTKQASYFDPRRHATEEVCFERQEYVKAPQHIRSLQAKDPPASWCTPTSLGLCYSEDRICGSYSTGFNWHLPGQLQEAYKSYAQSYSPSVPYGGSEADTGFSSTCTFLAVDSPLLKPSCSTVTDPGKRYEPSDTWRSNSALHSLADKDEYLVRCKLAGMSYKDIKKNGHFHEAESTLRGRFRNLTKPKLQRVRKPIWKDNDVRLLLEAVQEYQGSRDTKHPHRYCNEKSTGIKTCKIPWKKVGQYISNHGGSYHFGNATCRKKWDEIMGVGRNYVRGRRRAAKLNFKRSRV